MIDHVFVLVEENGPELAYCASSGLVETYRRNHPGQGTENACYCFDNLFLELLWVKDSQGIQTAAVGRTKLHERSFWRTNGSCPFGIAWRQDEKDPLSVPTWQFEPPYLLQGVTIAVATDSDDPRQPMMFKSTGAIAPVEWPPEKRGALQHGSGLGAVTAIQLTMPTDTTPSAALLTIAEWQSGLVSLVAGQSYRLQLQIASLADGPPLQLAFP